MKTNEMKVASAPSTEKLAVLINKFYYSTSYVINPETLEISNKFGIFTKGKVIKKGKRFYYYANRILHV